MQELRKIKAGIGKGTKAGFAACIFLCGIASSISTAEAALLHGYVNNENLPEQPQGIISSRVQESRVMRRDSFPTDLQGSWRCVTLVTDSLVDSVPVGQKLVSQTDFVKAIDGRVIARCQQDGWTPAQESVTTFSPTQYQMERTNYYLGDASAGSWAARSRDRYLLVEKNRMIAESEVDQYINGQFVGRYKTRSTLVRTSGGMENVASHPIPDPDDYTKK